MYSSWAMAAFQEFRVNEGRPFKYTETCFGAVLIKSEKCIEKNSIALMTYAIIRPVHIELVPGLASTTLVRYLCWFMSRRGIPKAFISYNAKPS